MRQLKSEPPLVMGLEDVDNTDVSRVGGKNASLGEMIQRLGSEGIPVPPGFALTADAYREFITANDLQPSIQQRLDELAAGRITLAEAGHSIRDALLHAPLPETLVTALASAYDQLCARLRQTNAAVAVRSSATAEDLPEASFAGQQASFLNIRGIDDLLTACRQCYASLFTDRAISYREAQGFDHLQVALSVGIQEMVDASEGAAGVMFTLDPESGFPDAVVINAAWGLGEAVVQGRVIADRYMIYKPLLAQPRLTPIFDKTLGSQKERLAYQRGTEGGVAWVDTTPAQHGRFVLSDSDTLQLARWARRIEQHYGCAMDIEWARDGISGDLYIVQARPETVASQKSRQLLSRYRLKDRGKLLLEGSSVGSAIASGPVRIIRNPEEQADFPEGSILVAEHTDPDWVPLMRRAAAVITDTGGPTSHAAIVCRELKIPAAVGAVGATESLPEGEAVTLSCAEGATAKIYAGNLPFEQTAIDLSRLPQPRTQVNINIAIPDSALQWWQLPVGGIGLARIEFIVSSLIGVHPLALLQPEHTDEETRLAIAELARGHPDPARYFIDRLALGVAKLAASQYPKPVIVRFSDFKTNEYSKLLGGGPFESPESNPMLGLRGAARYYSERYRKGFGLECQAIKRVREQLGFDNVIVMIPFCRTPTEADRVLEVMAENGLERGKNGLEVYVMCEIPANVVLADRFSERFDGFSIGSNDLTQLVLGVDRDSAELAYLFDARNEAVTRMISQVIEVAHRYGRKVGICGQAPSDHPDFAAFLVQAGIDSISLNPDSVVSTLGAIAAAEQALAKTA
ncbi:phosphoenolpyruvate synthase [Porticoccus sp.]